MTVTVILLLGLKHPVALLRTASVALYTPAPAAAGTAMTIGVAGNAAFTTSTNPWASAAALKLILYSFAPPVVALYERFVVVTPEQTAGFAPKVMVGFELIVTVIG